MDSWIFQGGYPLVSVERNDDDPSRVTLRQERFVYTSVDEPQLWKIPAVLTLGGPDGRRTQRVLIDAETVEVTLDGPAEWIVANTSGSGFYRCTYDPVGRAAILANLDSLDEIERYGFVDDSWALVMSGGLSVADFVETIEHFAAETDVAIWRRILGAFASLNQIANDDEQAHIAGRLRAMAGPKLAELGFERSAGESDLDNELRAALFRSLGTTGQDTSLIDQARTLLGDDNADASMRSAAVAIIAEHGTTADFDDFVNRMQTATSPQDERRFIHALSDFPGQAEFDRMLTMTLDGTIRTQDAPYVVGGGMDNRAHGRRAWDHIAANWDEINEKYPANSIGRLLEGIRSLSKPADAEVVKEFLANHPVPQSGKQLDQSLERLDINVAFRAREAGNLGDVFALDG